MISIFLARRDFLLAGEQRNFAHLREIHPHRIVDALGRSLGKLRFEIQVDLFVFLVVVLDGFVLGGWPWLVVAVAALAILRGLLRLGRARLGGELGDVVLRR